MELKWLKDYLALIEHGSFSKAAAARFVTQPAFSRRIRSLENWLNVSLVDRDQYPTSLTSAGEAFTEHAQQLINQIYSSRNHLQQLDTSNKHISIMAQHALAVAFFPAWMNTFKTLADKTLIRVEAGNLHDTVEAFLCNNGDFLLSYASKDIFNRLDDGNVLSLELGDDELVPVSVSNEAGDALYNLDIEQPLKLLTHPAESFFGRLIQRECLPYLPKELNVNTVCENALSEALKALVLQGHGVAWLPRSLITQELETRKLIQLDEPMMPVKLKIKLYRLKQSRNENAESFWDYLKKNNLEKIKKSIDE